MSASLGQWVWLKATKLPWRFSSFLRGRVPLNFPPRQWNRSLEFRTSYPRKKFAMTCFSAFTPRPSCPNLQVLFRVFPRQILPLSAEMRRYLTRRATLPLDQLSGGGARRWILMLALRPWNSRNWNSSWISQRGTGGRIGAEILAASQLLSKEAPISWRCISTFIACVIASRAAIVGTGQIENSNSCIAAMHSASRLFSASNKHSRETHVSR